MITLGLCLAWWIAWLSCRQPSVHFANLWFWSVIAILVVALLEERRNTR